MKPRLRPGLTKVIINSVLITLVLLWAMPTFGLLVTSFRAPFEAAVSGWWEAFPHRDYVATGESLDAADICDANGGCNITDPITVEGTTATFDEWKQGIELEDGRFARWIGTLRVGRLEFQEREWVFPRLFWTTVEEIDVAEHCAQNECTADGLIQIKTQVGFLEEWQEGNRIILGRRAVWDGDLNSGTIFIQERDLSFDLYVETIFGSATRTEVQNLTTGEIELLETRDQPLYENFFNSFIVTLPATIIPIFIAAMAAYAFAWMRFRGRRIMYILLLMLLVVPVQIALVPLLSDFAGLGINGTFLAVWVAHTGFGVPTATYLLYNYISQLPKETLESAQIDGASHFTIFIKIVLPLALPAIVSFVIFQFLWVWNDYLLAIIFLGQDTEVLTQQIVNFAGAEGSSSDRASLLPAAAFISFLVPLILFLALQRYFIRGLLTGSVKG